MNPELEEWERERRERRLEAFRARRPAAFAAPGALDVRVHQWLEAVARGEARTLVLAGPTGTGKSWTLWRAAETLLYNAWPGRVEVISAYDLMRLVAPPTDEPALDRLADVELLGLDDIGATRLSEWTSEHLAGLIDRRWANRRPTMIAANVPDLRAMLGDRIASRISDGQVPIVLNGPDRRRFA